MSRKGKMISLLVAIFLLPALAFAQFGNGSYTPRLGMVAESSFTSGLGSYSMFNQSFAPFLEFKPDQKWTFSFGTLLSNTNVSGSYALQPSARAQAQSQGMFSTTLWASGAYQVNPRLTLTGASWLERNNLNTADMPMGPYALSNNSRGMMLGMDYRISEKFRFGAEINVSSGYNPFHPFNPYNRSPFMSNPRW